jgi:SAM-dependent methyltransferase
MTLRRLARGAGWRLRRAWSAVRRPHRGRPGAPLRASSEYRLVLPGAFPVGALQGWQAPEVSERQLDAYRPLLEAMHAGRVRRDFAVAAECLRLLSLANPTIVEIGCGNGVYSEVFASLYGCPHRYVGVDYSEAMVTSARTRYGALPVVVADASTLPFSARAFDVAWSGTVLMHVPDYAGAIREACRVSRRFCVFHSVPVRLAGPTLFLTKRAYGVTVAEVLINRANLEESLRGSGLTIRHVLPSLPYRGGGVADDLDTLTYVCERVG